jgi:hypothetical protein
MLHRGPVVITSLEEDFKKIGLIAESTETETEVEEGTEEDGDNLDEVRIRRRTAAGKRTLQTTKRTPASVRMKSKRKYKQKKFKIKRARAKKMRKPAIRRRAKILRKRAAKRRGESTEGPIANLIAEVADIVSSIEKPQADATDAIKSFANIAIISDLLANTFTEWSDNLDESYSDQDTYDELADAAESLADLAEAAAEIATALKEGEEVGDEEGELETLFKEYMEDLLEGMDLYNEVMSEMDTMHGKGGNVGQPNAIKKKGTRVAEGADEDDDDDDDEEDGKKKKMPDFIKKKVAAKGEAAEDDDGDEDDDEGDDEEPEEESKKKRPSKR